MPSSRANSPRAWPRGPAPRAGRRPEESALREAKAEAPLFPDLLERYTAGPRSGVFTDGSCEGNPGPGGWGFVWVEDDRILAQGRGGAPATTNNRMELTALIEAYRVIPPDAAVTVYSDSQLCVKTINEWAAGWERRGWRRKSGPIANLELVKELYALAHARPRARLCWIRAHDGSRWNEYADALATSHMGWT